jgi:hypothetical protein
MLQLLLLLLLQLLLQHVQLCVYLIRVIAYLVSTASETQKLLYFALALLHKTVVQHINVYRC